MYRFIEFNDEKIDSLLIMELTDLTRTFTKNSLFETELQVHSYLNRKEHKVFVSHFWTHRDPDIMRAGLKSDVFLRSFGNMFYTDEVIRKKYLEDCYSNKLPRFAKQIFIIAEDLRLEAVCIRERPGMKKEFSIRRDVYLQHFESQLKVNADKNFFLDALLNLIYIWLYSNSPIYSFPSLSNELDEIIPFIQRLTEQFYDAHSTEEIAHTCKDLVSLLQVHIQKDMIHDYFHMYEGEGIKWINEESGMRKDPLVNQDKADDSATGDEEVLDQEMKTWHRETSSPGQTFLQFNLDQGTQTDILANEAREGEAGDQALAIVQGSAQKSSNKDFSDLEEIGKKDTERDRANMKYGNENKYARPIFLSPTYPTVEQRLQYDQLRTDVLTHQKKLKKTIDLTLEHKKQWPRTDLQKGRLSKKLIPFFTEDTPRLFYKKDQESNQIDAVFSLLIDCSASMFDKMEETRKGMILFHEALKSVQVLHEVIGFWEDANTATAEDQPNYFYQLIELNKSLQTNIGPNLMLLEAEEDNRDGFAIRVIGERLLKRSEKQKFLIVFSDGEPAAYGYNQNGIIDTHSAVAELRKKGVEIINIFLSLHEVGEEQRKVFQNIYGVNSLIAPSIELLPDILFPLLRKLLLKSI